MDSLHSEEYKGFTIKIVSDDNSESPRQWSNFGKMVCWHKRYNLGDEHEYKTAREFAAFIKEEKPPVVLPLYLYDHSGISISTSSFIGRAHHAEWDSGQVGYIYVTREALLSEHKGKKIITPAMKAYAEKVLIGEVNDYDQFLRGEIYGYEVIDKDGEAVDSCYGYYGDYSQKDGPVDEAKRTIDHEIKRREVESASQAHEAVYEAI